MALIKCTECGKEVSDKAATCPNCGCPVVLGDEPELETQSQQKARKKTNKKAVRIIGVCIAVLLLCSAYIYFFAAKDMRGYAAAKKLYDAGEYQACIDALDGNTYKYTADIIKYSQSKLQGQRIEEDKGRILEAESKEVAGDYDGALALLAEVQTQDVSQIVQRVEREKGMSGKADYSFLRDFESALLRRTELADENDSTSECVNAEINVLTSYKNAVFYDEHLGTLAQKYIAALEKQKENVKCIDASEVTSFYEATLDRAKIILSLNTEYGILVDKPNVLATYSDIIKEYPVAITARTAIDKDIKTQLEGETVRAGSSRYEYYLPYINTTEYTILWIQFDIFFEVDGVRTGQTVSTHTHIGPGQTVNISFSAYEWFENADVFWHFEV